MERDPTIRSARCSMKDVETVRTEEAPILKNLQRCGLWAQGTSTGMLAGALFVSKAWKQPQCLSAEEQMDFQICIQ